MINITPDSVRYMTRLGQHVQTNRTVEGLSEEEIYSHERHRIDFQILMYANAGSYQMEYFPTIGVPPHDNEHSILSGLHYRYNEDGFNAVFGRDNKSLIISWSNDNDI